MIASSSAIARIALRPAARPVARAAIAHFSSSSSARSTPPPPAGKGKAPARPASSLKAGTAMPGLNVFKDGADPVALADEEYPAWLWTLLEEPKGPAEGEFDFVAERRKIRQSNRTKIKAANYLKTT
ncbi:hypothetical protein Q8F55_002648 [Vanrija albida]|uniref:Large ribosomal subunit protein mL54 n=1 Tax=Vanrija albida TaxID=181172 RepID=A0ABR3QAY7_9TREE